MRPRSLTSTFDKLMKPNMSAAAIARRKGVPCSECAGTHVRPNGQPSCDGHNATGRPCRNAPIRGGYVCAQRHGGSAPQVKAAAAKRLAYAETEGEVARLLREVDVPGGVHPLDGLLDVIRRTGSMVSVLGRLTGQLDSNPAATWTTVTLGKDAHREIRVSENAALTGFDHNGNQAPDVLVELYSRWLRLYLDACKSALAADVDERMVRSASMTSYAFLKALNVGMNVAQLSPEQHDNFVQAVAAELRSLTPGLFDTNPNKEIN